MSKQLSERCESRSKNNLSNNMERIKTTKSQLTMHDSVHNSLKYLFLIKKQNLYVCSFRIRPCQITHPVFYNNNSNPTFKCSHIIVWRCNIIICWPSSNQKQHLCVTIAVTVNKARFGALHPSFIYSLIGFLLLFVVQVACLLA